MTAKFKGKPISRNGLRPICRNIPAKFAMTKNDIKLTNQTTNTRRSLFIGTFRTFSPSASLTCRGNRPAAFKLHDKPALVSSRYLFGF
jgi:hypothetical protein